MINRAAFKESFNDTVIGTMINFPMNFVLLYVGLALGMSALPLSIFMTTILFILAVIRKYHVRMHYSKQDND